jgi:N-acylglucosamine 2-epimerase
LVHAAECGWFVLEYAQRHGDKALTATALDVIDWAFDAGWDGDHGGGLIYFRDAEGFSPSA